MTDVDAAARRVQQEILSRFERQQEYLGPCKPVNARVPRVSITLVTYNHAPFIAQAIDSVLEQATTFPTEIVIGEDGSTDGTREICMRYAEQRPDVIRLFLRDRSVSILTDDSRTRVLNGHFTRMSARGEYVALLEGDDYWTDSSKLRRQVECLDADPRRAGCFTNARIVNEAEPNERQLHYPDEGVTGRALEAAPLPSDDVSVRQLILQRRILIMTWMIRRRVLHGLPPWYYDIPYCDRALAVLAAERGPIRYLRKVTTVYRRHAGGMWTGATDVPAKHEASATVFSRLNRHLGPAYGQATRSMVAKQYLTIAKHCLKTHDGARAEFYAAKGREALQGLH